MRHKLLNFLHTSPWDDTAIRSFATDFALAEIRHHEPLQAYVLDDTGLLKQGKHSVGVQRQYTGTAGKITHCQVAVSLTVTTASTHLPLDLALSLPKSRTDDSERRAQAQVPPSVVFRTKHELAHELLSNALERGLPHLPVLADAA